MNPQDAREKLALFLSSLQDSLFGALLDKGVAEIHIITTTITSEHGLVIHETGNICEGVLKVLKGEDSPSNLVAFIEKDERIEEDNRSKIPEIAYEIQTKIFDPVLPILKQAGFKVKEGRVAKPITNSQLPISNKEDGMAEPTVKYEEGSMQDVEAPSRIQNSRPNAIGGQAEFRIQPSQTQSSRIPAPILPSSPQPSASGTNKGNSTPIDEKNIRALVRIASGTSYNEEQLQDSFLSLPQGLRQSLSSVDTANAIQDIAKRYLLHVDQMAELASETGLVLLGLTHPADFIKNLSRRLRLPEERAREIARDISAQILVKVREGLRNLHENTGISNTESRTSNVEKSRGTNSAKLPTTNYQLPTSSTPYSAGAKWNTGENILAKQVRDESSLNRAEVLRDIENPKATKRDSYLETKSYEPPTVSHYSAPIPPKATLVGPTGWKPGGNEERSMKDAVGGTSMVSRSPEVTIPSPQMPVPPPSVPTPPGNEVGRNVTERSVPTPPAQKARPQSEVPSYTSAPKPPPQDFLDQKLQGTVTIPREEKRYTTDPYREPLQ